MLSVLVNQKINRKYKKTNPSGLFSASHLKSVFILFCIASTVLYLLTSSKGLSLLARVDRAGSAELQNMSLATTSFDVHRPPVSETIPGTVLEAASESVVVPISETDTRKTYSIKQDETLYEIARRNGVSVFQLILLNKIQDPTRIRPGQTINIPPEASGGGGISIPDKWNIDSDVSSGTAPLKVRFNLETDIDPDSYMWDLGNWTFAFERNPTTVFKEPGIYNVKLRGQSGGGPVVSDKFITVKVLPGKRSDTLHRFLTLKHPGAELNLRKIVPESLMSGSSEVFQRPVLFEKTDPLLYKAVKTGYTKITVTGNAANHSLFTFISPYPSVHSYERDFDWYKTQFGTGIVGNCGPATVAMASHWASRTDTSVASIRSEIGMPFANGAINFEHMIKPLRNRRIQFLFRPLTKERDIMDAIDRGNIVIVLIHTGYIQKTRGNRVENMVGRYYGDSTGHFVVIKGYTLDKSYFVVYDPIPSDWRSNKTRYSDGVSMLGKNRFYPVSQVMRASRKDEMLEIYYN